MSRFGDLVFINTSSHPELGKRVAEGLEVKPLIYENGSFPNNELDIRRVGDLSGKDVCIFSSLHSHYDTVGEFRRICSTIQGATRIFGVFPFVRDGKSDHVKRYGEAVNYKVVAHDISSSGIDLGAIFDQHSSQHQYYYDTMNYRLKQMHHLYLMRILIEYARDFLQYDGLLALDNGGFKRNSTIANMLQCEDVSFILKWRHPTTREVNIDKSKIIGDVKGKTVIGFEDMIQEGGTIDVGSQIAKRNGAKAFIVLAVHNDCSENTFNRLNPLLENGAVDKVVVIETIPMVKSGEWHKNMIILSPHKFLKKVIDRIHYEKHMRSMFLAIS